MAYLNARGIAKRNIVRQHPLHRNRLFFKTRTIISYIRIPNVHQSTAAVWPCAAITSGAMYSEMSPYSAYEVSDQMCDLEPSVPTKEFVRKLAVHVIVSTIGILFRENKTHAPISSSFNYLPHYAQIAPSLAFHPTHWIVSPSQSPTT